jgi:predicted nucleotidyltransferase
MQILFTTCVGSHMWYMETDKSDIDHFHAYMVPARTILEGRGYPRTLPQKITLRDGKEYDEIWWEIGHLVDQLIKGNANAIWSTLSPVVIRDSPELQDLRVLVQENLSRETYSSLKGIAQSHCKDALKSPELGRKGLRTAMRTIGFGLKLLNSGCLTFSPVEGEVTLEDVKKAMLELDEAYILSNLPDRPDQEPFRSYLYNIRLQNLYSEGI